MRRAEQREGAGRAALEEDLEEARERLAAERAAQRLAAERVEATTREVELLRADLAATRQNLDKAEGDKTRVSACSMHPLQRPHICAHTSFCTWLLPTPAPQPQAAIKIRITVEVMAPAAAICQPVQVSSPDLIAGIASMLKR